MRIQTNKMFSSKVLREILNDLNIKEAEHLIHLITFKKVTKRMYKKEIKYSNFSTFYLSNNNKIIIYIKPYYFYKYISSGIIHDSLSYYFKIVTLITHYFYSILYDIGKHYSIDFNMDLFALTKLKAPSIMLSTRIKEDNIFYKYYFRTTVRRDFGGIIHFHSKGITTDWGAGGFSYALARYFRIKSSNFKGFFTFNEIKKYVLSDYIPTTNYSLKKELSKIDTPVTYKKKNKENAKTFTFYTKKHADKIQKKYEKQILEQQQFMNNIGDIKW